MKSACEESKWAFLLTVKRIGARQKRSCELAKLSLRSRAVTVFTVRVGKL